MDMTTAIYNDRTKIYTSDVHISYKLKINITKVIQTDDIN